jgi:hypothetical protein
MATDTLTPTRHIEKERKPSGGRFRAFWRWHFYAAFIVAPGSAGPARISPLQTWFNVV